MALENIGTQVTGNEAQDAEALLQKAVEDLYQKLHPSNTQSPDKPEPIKVNVFGQEATFNNMEELSKAIENVVEKTRENTTLQFQQQQQQQQSQKPETPTGSGFSQDRFAELIGTDVTSALNYALSHMLFDGKVEDAAGAMKTQLNDFHQQKQVLAAYQFREKFPQLNVDQQTFMKMDTLRQELGLPNDNPRSWEAAMSVGVMRGLIQDPRVQTQQQQQVQQPQYSQQVTGTRPQGPPMMGRSQQPDQVSPDFLQKLEELPEDELEKLARQMYRV